MTTKITINNNGSIRVEGEVELCDMEGNKYDLNGRIKISLCRCGCSNDKPFCDGAHKSCGFMSTVAAKTLPPLPQK